VNDEAMAHWGAVAPIRKMKSITNNGAIITVGSNRMSAMQSTLFAILNTCMLSDEDSLG